MVCAVFLCVCKPWVEKRGGGDGVVVVVVVRLSPTEWGEQKRFVP